ncbi:NmrA/HSCARG family protein [Mucilaginibacter corticis]|uniref:NmrA/HSCARG family protein n=1 Tax=Mucilaginibacter corticis TaxID=2597670 RepID=A0A556MRX0_9SPHI|nr:NmrA/HSCARG family protein [Mucilaginibacter corticis]TSJ42625.1 NmrA/HSCARG family protein [Mucilaginibacter corticis]
MKKGIIVVCGATGNQGGAVSRSLLADGKWHVIAITRDINSEKAKKLEELGAEIRFADLEDEASLINVFKNAYGVFGVTQPWAPDYSKCYQDKELTQGLNIINACKTAGIKHLVMSSVINYDNLPKGIGPYDSKLKIEAYLKSQKMLYTIVRCAQFMDNIGSHFFPVKNGAVKGFVAPDVKVPYIACKNIGSFNTVIFNDPNRFYCSTVNLVGDFISGNEIAGILQKIRHEPFVYRATSKFILRLFAPEFHQMRAMYEKIGRPPYASEVTDVINRSMLMLDEPITIKDHLIAAGYAA